MPLDSRPRFRGGPGFGNGLLSRQMGSDVVVGVLRIDLAIFEAQSLKDKRRVIKSLKDRLAHRFNVSVAEVDALDCRQRAVLGVAVVANESSFVHRSLDTIVDFVRSQSGANLLDYQRELYY